MIITDLVNAARTNPLTPLIEGLLNESETAGLHGPPECFKTFLTLQLAESLATGAPFLGVWRVPKPRTVFYFETEMSAASLGRRLAKMYADSAAAPASVHFADETQLRQFRKSPQLRTKFSLLNAWVQEAHADVLLLDTANPFFRGKQSASEETVVGEFFDLLGAVPAPTKFFVRHNRKPRADAQGLFGGDGVSEIRGSGQFADVPDLLIELRRNDKRTNQAILSVSKFRHGSKPDDLIVWLDVGTLRLVSLPPVIYLLQNGPLTRPQLLDGFTSRFGVKQRLADALIREELVKGEDELVCLKESMQGHTRVYEIDWEAARGADWYARIPLAQRGGGTVGDMQVCITSSLPLGIGPQAPASSP